MDNIHPVVRRVRTVSAAHSHAKALEDANGGMTYQQLLAGIDAAVDTLREVAVGDRVALYARRDSRLPVVLLALWQLGATVAVIDHGLPATRIANSERAVQPRWRVELGADVVVEHCGPRQTSHGSHILFTSGTTGRPAAVSVGADALDRTLDWYSRQFQLTHTDRIALLAGLGHDPLLRDMLVPLTVGGTLVIPAEEVRRSPAALASFVAESGLTVLHCTPGMIEMLLAGCPTIDHVDLGRLRHVVSGGAQLTVGMARRIRRITNAVIVNAYGATETPQIASSYVVPESLLEDASIPDHAAVSVGTGAGGTELVLPGDRGEIVVRSPNLAIGYVERTGPDERFIDDPRGAHGYRAYRTGDIGTRDSDSQIRIVGRIDREMAVNGFRIAPEDIESAARSHPAVLQAHAATMTGAVGDFIALSVVLGTDDGVTPNSIRAFLRSQLPSYSIPSRIQIVPALPLDLNFKVSPTTRS